MSGACANETCFYPCDKPKPIPLATKGPLVYNPIVGWKTGGSLLVMLAVFILCFGVERLKKWCVKMSKYRHIRKELKRIKANATCDTLMSEKIQIVKEEGILVNHVTDINKDNDIYSSDKAYEDCNVLDTASCDTDCSEEGESVLCNSHQQNLASLATTDRNKVVHKSNAQNVVKREDPFGLRVIEVHPDCPLHSPTAQNRLRNLLSYKT